MNLDFSSRFFPVVQALTVEIPSLIITSGKRDLVGQLTAMISNEIASPGFIRKTYLPTPLVGWLSRQAKTTFPESKRPAFGWTQADASRAAIALSFDVKEKFSAADIGRLSKHLTGDAVDFKYDATLIEPIQAVLSGRPEKTKFLTREGGLPRLHVQMVD